MPFTNGLLRPFVVGRLFMFFARQPHTSELVPGSPTQRGRRAWRPLAVLGVVVDGEGPTEGLGVSLDHRTVVFLQGIGLASDDPTAEDLVEFNTTNFGWIDVRDLAEVEVFDSPAIRVRVTPSEGRESIQYQGVRADTGEVFLLGFGAPTGEILDEFLPTWDAMFESITATE